MRNEADNAAYTAEKTLRDLGDKVPADLKTDVETRIAMCARRWRRTMWSACVRPRGASDGDVQDQRVHLQRGERGRGLGRRFD